MFTSSQMYDGASGKIVESLDAQPALLVPGPVGRHGVDEAGDHDAVDDVGAKVAALGKGTWKNAGKSVSQS